MSRELLNVNNTETIKQSDDSTTIILSAHDDNEPRIFKAGDIGTIHITTENYHIPSIPAKLIIGSNNVNINSADLVDLPAGKYSLELWVSQQDGPKATIYPSSGSLALTIDKNADDLTDKTLTTLTLDDLRKDLHADVADAVKHIKVDASMLDLSDYAKKSDIPTVPSVALDVDKRTLTIDKQTISIPDSVDLSGYAKTAEVPSVKYDAQTKTLTVNGVTVEIPSNVDLSNYYTKEQVDQQIKNNKTTVDLTDYVKREELVDLAKKQDVPSVTLDTAKRTITVNGTVINIPDNVDLSSYATKAELPKVTLDVAKRQIEVGDATLDVPGNVDLSNYYTKSEVDDKLTTAAAGGKVDLSGYVKTEQLSDYAKKQDVPSVVYNADKKQLTINGVNVDLPNNVDLSDYVRKEDTADFAKKSDIPTVPTITLDTAKRTLTVNSNVINIPDSVDLTGYVKSADLTNYALKSDIPAAPDLSEYAKKSDIKTVDLTPYLKKTDADAKYATKAEIPDLSGYAKKTDIKTVDLTPYLTKTTADSTYATKADVTAVEKQPGTPGKDGYSVWSADGVQGGMGQRGVNVSDLKPSSDSSRAKIGDLVIDTKLGAIYSIVAISDGYATFSQNYGNLVGPQGEQGHGLWYSTVNAVETSVPVSDIAGYDQYSNVLPKTNDVVIDSEGNVTTISYLTYDYTQTPYKITAVNTGSSLGKLSGGSSNIPFSVSSDSFGNVNIAFNNQGYTLPIHTDKPDDYNYGYTNTRQFVVVANRDLKKYLHILDDTTQYTLDVDTGKVNNYGIVPGIYPLRDNGISNLKITSGSNYEGLKDKPTYIIQYIQDVEYAKIMYLTTDFTVHYAVRPIWAADNYNEYYGSHYSWHEI